LCRAAIAGAEALLRWRHPERGLVAPGEFVPVLEETGLIEPVGTWVIRTVCEQIRAWQAQGLPAFPVAVNLSGRQLQHNDLARTIAEILEETGVSPRLLELEVTESMLMHDPKLKIDQSFVRDILIDPNDAAIAQMVVALGNTLGLRVIAEGVETEAQRAYLQSLGCSHYQGYMFGKPMSAAQLTDLVQSRNRP